MRLSHHGCVLNTTMPVFYTHFYGYVTTCATVDPKVKQRTEISYLAKCEIFSVKVGSEIFGTFAYLRYFLFVKNFEENIGIFTKWPMRVKFYPIFQ